MKARLLSLLGLTGGLLLMASAVPGTASAGECCAPPPPCCKPPPPPPPSNPPCCTPGHNVKVPGINVNVSSAVVVNAQANARVIAGAGAGAGAAVFYGGGGGGGYYSPPVATGLIGGLNVEGLKKKVAYEATRTKTVRVVIRAVCMDTKEVPHPASQVFSDRDVADGYEGELYRCLAGTTLQYTWAEYLDKVSFDGGKSVMCKKGDALWHSRGGKLECRPAKPARDCNERSLLRRFGAGIKVMTMVITETYTAYREESETHTGSLSLSLDGGVGGTVY